MRLIDADALKGALEKLKAETMEYEDNLDDVDAIIDNAPTVEYPFYQEAYQTGYEEGKNERPQGEWLKAINEFFNWECSLCHKPHDFKDNFCPNCGADMRGEHGTENL